MHSPDKRKARRNVAVREFTHNCSFKVAGTDVDPVEFRSMQELHYNMQYSSYLILHWKAGIGLKSLHVPYLFYTMALFSCRQARKEASHE